MSTQNSNQRLQISVYYKPKEHGNIKALLRTLSMESESIYSGRTESEIARMLILSKLKEMSSEIESLKQELLDL